MEKLNFMILVM